MAGISHELGLPDDVREWSLDDGEVRDGKKAHKHPRDCPRCQTVFWGRLCPACAYQEPMAEVQMVDTELEDARLSQPAPPVKGGRRKELNRELEQIHQLPQEKKQAALFDLAARRGYKRGWAQRIWEIWQTSRQFA